MKRRVVRVGMAEPDPFDHSHCYHEPPHFPIQVGDRHGLDLLAYLHGLYKTLRAGDTVQAIASVIGLGQMLTDSVMGNRAQVDDRIEFVQSVARGIEVLRDRDAFEAEIRRLMEEEGGE